MAWVRRSVQLGSHFANIPSASWLNKETWLLWRLLGLVTAMNSGITDAEDKLVQHNSLDCGTEKICNALHSKQTIIFSGTLAPPEPFELCEENVHNTFAFLCQWLEDTCVIRLGFLLTWIVSSSQICLSIIAYPFKPLFPVFNGLLRFTLPSKEALKE